jgi:hypothetical protein
VTPPILNSPFHIALGFQPVLGYLRPSPRSSPRPAFGYPRPAPGSRRPPLVPRPRAYRRCELQAARVLPSSRAREPPLRAPGAPVSLPSSRAHARTDGASSRRPASSPRPMPANRRCELQAARVLPSSRARDPPVRPPGGPRPPLVPHPRTAAASSRRPCVPPRVPRPRAYCRCEIQAARVLPSSRARVQPL